MDARWNVEPRRRATRSSSSSVVDGDREGRGRGLRVDAPAEQGGAQGARPAGRPAAQGDRRVRRSERQGLPPAAEGGPGQRGRVHRRRPPDGGGDGSTGSGSGASSAHGPGRVRSRRAREHRARGARRRPRLPARARPRWLPASPTTCATPRRRPRCPRRGCCGSSRGDAARAAARRGAVVGDVFLYLCDKEGTRLAFARFEAARRDRRRRLRAAGERSSRWCRRSFFDALHAAGASRRASSPRATAFVPWPPPLSSSLARAARLRDPLRPSSGRLGCPRSTTTAWSTLYVRARFAGKHLGACARTSRGPRRRSATRTRRCKVPLYPTWYETLATRSGCPRAPLDRAATLQLACLGRRTPRRARRRLRGRDAVDLRGARPHERHAAVHADVAAARRQARRPGAARGELLLGDSSADSRARRLPRARRRAAPRGRPRSQSRPSRRAPLGAHDPRHLQLLRAGRASRLKRRRRSTSRAPPRAPRAPRHHRHGQACSPKRSASALQAIGGATSSARTARRAPPARLQAEQDQIRTWSRLKLLLALPVDALHAGGAHAPRRGFGGLRTPLTFGVGTWRDLRAKFEKLRAVKERSRGRRRPRRVDGVRAWENPRAVRGVGCARRRRRRRPARGARPSTARRPRR